MVRPLFSFDGAPIKRVLFIQGLKQLDAYTESPPTQLVPRPLVPAKKEEASLVVRHPQA